MGGAWHVSYGVGIFPVLVFLGGGVFRGAVSGLFFLCKGVIV